MYFRHVMICRLLVDVLPSRDDMSSARRCTSVDVVGSGDCVLHHRVIQLKELEEQKGTDHYRPLFNCHGEIIFLRFCMESLIAHSCSLRSSCVYVSIIVVYYNLRSYILSATVRYFSI